MKHIIDKSFNWEAGHRVWSQKLDSKYTSRGDTCTACRHFHGHSYLCKVFLEETVPGKNIEKTGMVIDFKMIGFVKDFIDDHMDHKMIMDKNDPILPSHFPYLIDDDGRINLEKNCHQMPEGYWIPNLTIIRETLDNYIENFNMSVEEADAIFEIYEGLVIVDFLPTSENLAGWLFTIIEERFKELEEVKVNAVELWETPKSHVRCEA